MSRTVITIKIKKYKCIIETTYNPNFTKGNTLAIHEIALVLEENITCAEKTSLGKISVNIDLL